MGKVTPPPIECPKCRGDVEYDNREHLWFCPRKTCIWRGVTDRMLFAGMPVPR